MLKLIVVAVLGIFLCAGIACAADESAKAPQAGFGQKAVKTVTDTAESGVTGTANVAKVTVSDIGETPKTAIEAVKDTASTALTGADAALKTITGEDQQ